MSTEKRSYRKEQRAEPAPGSQRTAPRSQPVPSYDLRVFRRY